MWGIRSTNIVHADRIVSGVILIEGQHIHSIVQEAPEGIEIEDVGDLAVMAGGVDSHVHINEPGRTEWEGFETATKAALKSGLTTLVDMPLNCSPVTTTLDAFEQKLASMPGKCHVDVGFWAGVVPDSVSSLDALMQRGTLGGKAFMCHSGIDEFPAADEETLRQSLKIFKRYDVPLLAHAEITSEVALPALPTTSYQCYLASRPTSWEIDAIEMLIRLCRETGAHVHIVHLSAADALPMIKEAREEGLPLTVETCPHYLCLQAEDIPDASPLYKCAPPIREKANRDALWQGLEDGLIDFVISDHSPCPTTMKELESGDYFKAWGGISSLDLGLSLLWTEASGRGYGLTDIARWLCEGPARFAGIEAQKGNLAPGTDADIVIWDPEVEYTLQREHLVTRHAATPYLGMSLKGQVKKVYLRGEVALDEEGFHPPRGQALLHQHSNT